MIGFEPKGKIWSCDERMPNHEQNVWMFRAGATLGEWEPLRYAGGTFWLPVPESEGGGGIPFWNADWCTKWAPRKRGEMAQWRLAKKLNLCGVA